MKQVVNKKLTLDLVGVDGNAYTILAAFKRQARAENWSDKEIELVMEEAQSKDYNHLLATILNHSKSKDEED